jgi:hypothetical protein
MHALMLLLLLAPETQAKPLRIWDNVPPIARACTKGTAAVRYNRENEEHAACYEHLKCADGSDYGTGACVCKPGMPLLDQDEVVTGCTAKAADKKPKQTE